MSDEKRRALERKAATDPEARRKWLRELVRVGDERIVRIDAHKEKLAAALEKLRKAIDKKIAKTCSSEEKRNACPELAVAALEPALAAALEERTGLGDLGWGWEELARVWPTARTKEQWRFDRYESGHPELAPQPFVAIAFVARVQDKLVVRVGLSEYVKASPGTTWPNLQPWRDNLKKDTLATRFKAWTRAKDAVKVALEDARIWIDLASTDSPEKKSPKKTRKGAPGFVDGDPPSEKQLGFIAVLKKRKKLDDAAFSKLMNETAGCKDLEHLGKRGASALIEALLAL